MTSPRNFGHLLDAQMARGYMVCVGLDSNHAQVPPNMTQYAFNRRVVDLTGEVAQSYKLQIAFYEGVSGSYQGLDALAETVTYIKDNLPDTPIILDAKRGDIGNTNLGYIHAAFGQLGVDALTIAPFMGRVEGLQPFLDQKDKGLFVLCRTSNGGGAELQDLQCYTWLHVPTGDLYANPRHAEVELGDAYDKGDFKSGPSMPLYEFVAHRVTGTWDSHGNCGLVVGATRPEELKRVRSIVGSMPILIPGLGAQGGDARAMLEAGLDEDGQGVVINNSRAIIFAGDPGAAALEFHQYLCELRDDIMGSRACG